MGIITPIHRDGCKPVVGCIAVTILVIGITTDDLNLTSGCRCRAEVESSPKARFFCPINIVDRGRVITFYWLASDVDPAKFTAVGPVIGNDVMVRSPLRTVGSVPTTDTQLTIIIKLGLVQTGLIALVGGIVAGVPIAVESQLLTSCTCTGVNRLCLSSRRRGGGRIGLYLGLIH